MKPPFELYEAAAGGLFHLTDADGHIAEVEDKDIAEAILARLNATVPRPIAEAEATTLALKRFDKLHVLAYFGPVSAGWYRANYDRDESASKPRPYWTCAEARYLGVLWARKNQPQVWLPLPPTPIAPAHHDGQIPNDAPGTSPSEA